MSTQAEISGDEIIERVLSLGDEEVAKFSQRYFKTGEGEYGHGDRVVGAHLFGWSTRPLKSLAKSPDIWERRIAIIATLHFIKRGEYDATLEVAELLLSDREDLTHKAADWMLREVGKRDQAAEERFLRERYRRMPRTMLRYAIEKFPEPLRRSYLEGRV